MKSKLDRLINEQHPVIALLFYNYIKVGLPAWAVVPKPINYLLFSSQLPHVFEISVPSPLTFQLCTPTFVFSSTKF